MAHAVRALASMLLHLAQRTLPAPPAGALGLRLVRSAVCGVLAALVSDLISNSLRVLKVRHTTLPHRLATPPRHTAYPIYPSDERPAV